MAQLKEGSVIKKSTGDEVIATLNDIPNLNDIPTALSQLDQDENNRLVTDAEKTGWNNKVDKETGKGLSSNDYTTTEKNKLSGIQDGAEKNVITSVNGQTGAVTTPDTKYTAGTNVSISGTTISATDTKYTAGTNVTISGNTISATNTTYGVATTSSNGLMSSADKTKLDGVETGAQKNSITSVQGRTGAVTISKSDVGLGSVNNVAITAAQVTKINELNYTRAMTQAQYNALTTTEKNRTDVWYGIYK